LFLSLRRSLFGCGGKGREAPQSPLVLCCVLTGGEKRERKKRGKKRGRGKNIVGAGHIWFFTKKAKSFSDTAKTKYRCTCAERTFEGALFLSFLSLFEKRDRLVSVWSCCTEGPKGFPRSDREPKNEQKRIDMGLFGKKKGDKGGKGAGAGGDKTECNSFPEMMKAFAKVVGDAPDLELGQSGEFEKFSWEWDEDVRNVTIKEDGEAAATLSLVESKLDDSDSDDIF
jgi:hypothetical protein